MFDDISFATENWHSEYRRRNRQLIESAKFHEIRYPPENYHRQNPDKASSL